MGDGEGWRGLERGPPSPPCPPRTLGPGPELPPGLSGAAPGGPPRPLPAWLPEPGAAGVGGSWTPLPAPAGAALPGHPSRGGETPHSHPSRVTGVGTLLGRRRGHPISYPTQAPVFLLFLDCTWQLLRQFPADFGFTEAFLLALHDSSFSPYFSTFRFSCQRQRDHGSMVRGRGTLLHPQTFPFHPFFSSLCLSFSIPVPNWGWAPPDLPFYPFFSPLCLSFPIPNGRLTSQLFPRSPGSPARPTGPWGAGKNLGGTREAPPPAPSPQSGPGGGATPSSSRSNSRTPWDPRPPLSPWPQAG